MAGFGAGFWAAVSVAACSREAEDGWGNESNER